MTGVFLQLSRLLPDEYPLTGDVDAYLSDELGFGRLLDFGVILPRLQQIYEWSADELGEPGLRDCVRDGAMTYAWPFEERHVWRTRPSFLLADGPTPPPARAPGGSDGAVRGPAADLLSGRRRARRYSTRRDDPVWWNTCPLPAPPSRPTSTSPAGQR